MTMIPPSVEMHHTNQNGYIHIRGGKGLEYECLKFDMSNTATTLRSPSCHVIQTAVPSSDVQSASAIASSEETVDSSGYNPHSHSLYKVGSSYGNVLYGLTPLAYMSSIRSWTTAGKISHSYLYDPPPSMVHSLSGSLSSLPSDGDDTISSSSGCDEDDVDPSADGSTSNTPKGVTFDEKVRVMPIPPVSAYTAQERLQMYANKIELRQNKLRNKKEYAFDGNDWRNATEECHMAVCPMSGELLHPVHLGVM